MSGALRFAVVGLGNIGRQHVHLLQSGAIDGAEVSAVCSRTPVDLGAEHFTSLDDLLASGKADAALIATPTMEHLPMGLSVCKAGLHLLMEKPLAMSVGQARQLIKAQQPGQEFAVMLNQRFHPVYARIKQLLDEGALGALQRLAWTMTTWYRPDIYYQVSSWRGTWPGEGGGLLINQCIHNLDVLVWLTGMPARIYAQVGFGKYHDIEVEDEVTATLVHDSGLTATVTASSGEAPGINQLHLVGDRGSLRYDGERLVLYTADGSVREHCASTREMFGMPAFTQQEVAPLPERNQHGEALRNFVRAVRGKEELATPAAAGLGSIALANAMLLSAWRDAPVHLPGDLDAFDAALQERIAASSLRQPQDLQVQIDMEKSYR